MHRQSRPFRFLWHVLAALQLLLPGATAWADAQLQRESVRDGAHVESHSDKSCARVHDADCALCQFLGAAVRPAPSAACGTPPVVRAVPAPAALAAVVARVAPATRLPRAPPGSSAAA